MSQLLERWAVGGSGSPKANAALTATFLATASVLRKAQVSDGAGGYIETFTSVHTYPCNFERFVIRPREVESSVRIQDITYWDFHFVPGADIGPTDRLQVGTRSFEIVGTGTGSSTVVLSIITLEIL